MGELKKLLTRPYNFQDEHVENQDEMWFGFCKRDFGTF